MNDAPYLALTGELSGVFRELYEKKYDRDIMRAPVDAAPTTSSFST